MDSLLEDLSKTRDVRLVDDEGQEWKWNGRSWTMRTLTSAEIKKKKEEAAEDDKVFKNDLSNGGPGDVVRSFCKNMDECKCCKDAICPRIVRCTESCIAKSHYCSTCAYVYKNTH